MVSSLTTSWQIEEEIEEGVTDFIFFVSKITVTAAMKLKDTCFFKGKL